MSELLKHAVDPKTGAVRQTLGIDVAASSGSDWFEWTLTRTGRVTQIRAYGGEIAEIRTYGGDLPDMTTPLPPGTGGLDPPGGSPILKHGTSIRITVVSPPGTKLHAELDLEYLTN